MKLGKGRRMPSSPCLSCGTVNDRAANVSDDGRDRSPRPGDINVCFRCGHVMAYDDGLRLRDLTPAEQIEIAGDKHILAMQRARAEGRK
jgi:hypothetical protein